MLAGDRAVTVGERQQQRAHFASGGMVERRRLERAQRCERCQFGLEPYRERFGEARLVRGIERSEFLGQHQPRARCRLAALEPRHRPARAPHLALLERELTEFVAD